MAPLPLPGHHPAGMLVALCPSPPRLGQVPVAVGCPGAPGRSYLQCKFRTHRVQLHISVLLMGSGIHKDLFMAILYHAGWQIFMVILRLLSYRHIDFHGIISHLYSYNQARKNQMFHLNQFFSFFHSVVNFSCTSRSEFRTNCKWEK